MKIGEPIYFLINKHTRQILGDMEGPCYSTDINDSTRSYWIDKEYICQVNNLALEDIEEIQCHLYAEKTTEPELLSQILRRMV